MHINSTHVKNIRNVEDCSLAFSPLVNFLVGPNGAGKTALIEAFYVMSRGRGFRGRSTDALINNESDFLSIDIKVEAEGGLTRDVGGRKKRAGKLEYSLDGLVLKSFEEVGRQLPTQLILPNESELVYLGPEVRRAYLDWGLFHVEQSYLGLARAYRRALKQRNEWLKNRTGKADPWLEGLAELGVKINAFRQIYVDGVGRLFNRLVSTFFDLGPVSLKYDGGGYAEDLSGAVSAMYDSASRDARARTTNLGPHRADMIILVTELPARSYCSRGQAKLISLCLALSQALYLKDKKGVASILLIDDIVAELDHNNLIQSLELIKSMGMQTFITASDSAFSEKVGGLFGEQIVFHVEQGNFIKENDYGVR